jgi:hypothetical protein
MQKFAVFFTRLETFHHKTEYLSRFRILQSTRSGPLLQIVTPYRKIYLSCAGTWHVDSNGSEFVLADSVQYCPRMAQG